MNETIKNRKIQASIHICVLDVLIDNFVLRGLWTPATPRHQLPPNKITVSSTASQPLLMQVSAACESLKMRIRGESMLLMEKSRADEMA